MINQYLYYYIVFIETTPDKHINYYLLKTDKLSDIQSSHDPSTTSLKLVKFPESYFKKDLNTDIPKKDKAIKNNRSKWVYQKKNGKEELKKL